MKRKMNQKGFYFKMNNIMNKINYIMCKTN